MASLDEILERIKPGSISLEKLAAYAGMPVEEVKSILYTRSDVSIWNGRVYIFSKPEIRDYQ